MTADITTMNAMKAIESLEKHMDAMRAWDKIREARSQRPEDSILLEGLLEASHWHCDSTWALIRENVMKTLRGEHTLEDVLGYAGMIEAMGSFEICGPVATALVTKAVAQSKGGLTVEEHIGRWEQGYIIQPDKLTGTSQSVLVSLKRTEVVLCISDKNGLMKPVETVTLLDSPSELADKLSKLLDEMAR